MAIKTNIIIIIFIDKKLIQISNTTHIVTVIISCIHL